ncbi:uncharacterized protein LOC134699986 [Mytilus trossulus]|uniref:uncharacterized protein LOC134699986 n=1 Tax=Mytilus trossulus TaxID=6551 RepID=UPI003003F4C6
MDREDKRRFLVIGSVTMEIVAPLFQKRVKDDYFRKGMNDLQSYLDSTPVKHILFHLCFRNAYCCTDRLNCFTQHCFPLKLTTFNSLYQRGRTSGHSCHCNFFANPVQLDDLSVALSSFILLNCCNVSLADKDAIKNLRKMKNEFLTHNKNGGITQKEYNTLWPDITNWLLQLDPSKQDDLIRLKNRPLDEGLYTKYSTELFDIHSKLEEIHSEFNEIKDFTIKGREDSRKMLDRMEESNNLFLANMEVFQSTITEIKNTAPSQRSETVETQDEKNIIQYRGSSDVDVPNLTNVRKISKLRMVVDQTQNASFTMFSEGSHVQVGTIVVGDQNITMTDVDGMSQTTTNTQNIDSTPTQNNTLSLNTNSLFLLMLLLPCVIVIFVQNFLA